MSTTTLFHLTGDALRIQALINDAAERLISDDIAEAEAATSELEALIASEGDNRRAIEAKADAWCWAIDHLRARAAARKASAQRLSDLAIADDHQATALADRLIGALLRIEPDATGWSLPEHRITSRRSTAVEIDPDLQPADLPDDLRRVKTTYTADKTAIKAALQAGHDIPGAELVERRSWSIK